MRWIGVTTLGETLKKKAPIVKEGPLPKHTASGSATPLALGGRHLGNRRSSVAGALVFQTGAALVSFATTVYIATELGPSEFGRYALVIAILTFLSLIFDFGFFPAGARLLAMDAELPEQQGHFGALCLVAGGLGLLMIPVVFHLAALADAAFSTKVGPTLRAVAALSPAVLVPYFLEQALKGMGRVKMLSVWNLATKIAVAGGVALLVRRHDLSAESAAAVALSAPLGGLVVLALMLRPSVRGVGPYLRDLLGEQRSFGRALYAGRVANLLTYNMDMILLAVFFQSRAVGHYSLAVSVATPITLFSGIVAAIAFRTFTDVHPIERRVIYCNVAGVAVLTSLVILAGQFVLVPVFGESYAPVTSILYAVAVASGLQGLYQPYNSWLLANGLGSVLRGLLLRVTALNIVANLALIPTVGPVGAGLASSTSMGCYLFLSFRSYKTSCQ